MRIDHRTKSTGCCILSLLATMIKELCCPRTNLNNDDRTTEARVTQGPGAASSDDWGQVSTRGQGNWSPIVDVLAQNLA